MAPCTATGQHTADVRLLAQGRRPGGAVRPSPAAPACARGSRAWARLCRRRAVVRRLLAIDSSGWCVNARDKHGVTALHRAANLGETSLIHQLLKVVYARSLSSLSSSPTLAHSLSIPLSIALSLYLYQSIYLARSLAASFFLLSVLSLLLSHLSVSSLVLIPQVNADATVRENRGGETPREWAARAGHVEAEALLAAAEMAYTHCTSAAVLSLPSCFYPFLGVCRDH